MTQAAIDTRALTHENWDVIIIGTGMAGATLGYTLARQGKKVLFCEKGHHLLTQNSGLRGDFAETFFPKPSAPSPEHRDILLQTGRYAEEITELSDKNARRAIPFIGSGSGGSSALYGAALERLFPCDFKPRANHPSTTDSNLPEAWPISYRELAPYYEQAEKLFRIRGGGDSIHPCGNPGALPPPALHAASAEIKTYFESCGLSPYRLPQACEFVENCKGCQGFLCPKDCKNDSSRICLKPAINDHNAVLISNCEITHMETNSRSVNRAFCRLQGQELALKGKTIVLAAGALDTPRILLASSTTEWPNGLANSSGQVGRNLMRHYIDLYALPLPNNTTSPVNLKELAFNDFYQTDSGKYGTVQSFGALPNSKIIVEEITKDLRTSPFRMVSPAFNLVKPIVHATLKRIFANSVLFASIMEDLPYQDNTVSLNKTNTGSTSGINFHYSISPHEHKRIYQFRALIQTTLKTQKTRLLKQAENSFRLGHACGTCRFGNAPTKSVLDATNRCHDLDNLYIVDASFLPSSGGTNPSLTLAANALRVAEHIVNR